MKFSIIIPTYNRINLLKNILINLINQTEKNFEILIIDDNSNDSTKDEVQTLCKKYDFIKYYRNKGKGQRDGKKTGLDYSKGEYILFLEDDIEIRDKNFILKSCKALSDNKVIVSKIIMLDKGKKNITSEPKKYNTKPLALIELSKGMVNEGSKIRKIYPFMETGTIFHKKLSKYFIDNNLVLDGYGESFSSGIKLINAGIKIEFTPQLEIYHLGSDSGGSKKYHKKPMLKNFSLFHYGYFYNMIYLHSRYKPLYIIIWLPFYLSKVFIALASNKNFSGFYSYGIKPILISLYRNFFIRSYK